MDKVPGTRKNDSVENNQTTSCDSANGWQEFEFASKTRCFRSFGEIKGEDIISTCLAHNATILTPKNEAELNELYEVYKDVLGLITSFSLFFTLNGCVTQLR